MPVLIGTDEAGYGPNLGPLVITAVTWMLPDGTKPADLPQLLADVISDKADRQHRTLQIADSKQVYQAGKSLQNLELGVLAFLRTMKIDPPDLSALGKFLASSTFAAGYQALCGTDTLGDVQLPQTDCQPVVDDIAARLSDALKRTGIVCSKIESRIMFAEEFNRLVDATGSKGVVLSEATLKLVRSAVDAARGGPHAKQAEAGWVVCDKHGGRNRYDGLISDAFDDELVFRIQESRPSSRYRASNLEFCFRTKAEELMPVALASMVSKYVRELTMGQFNRFWQSQVSDLKPTKGYPVDALRFWEAIEGEVDSLGLAKDTLWRKK
ncbi:MAG: hypothetical protein ABJZ55_06325 [Fuerstiella sp.]